MLPDMLREGRIARLDAPTHGVKVGNKTHYFFGDEEFQKRSVKGEVTLFKGLGEMNPCDVKATMFGPNQHLTEFKWDSDTEELLKSLMGEDVEPRREFLFNNVDFSKIVE
jgi:DNA gyrase subunit B